MKVHEIYLDNAATTQPMEELKELFNHYVDSGWYNPSAAYDVAMELERQIVEAKELIKTAVGARKASVLFTSCGTEGDNTAILEGYRPQGNRKLHFITSIVEHPAVYETFLFCGPTPMGRLWQVLCFRRCGRIRFCAPSCT